MRPRSARAAPGAARRTTNGTDAVTIRPAQRADLPSLAGLWRDVDGLHARLWPNFFRPASQGSRRTAAIEATLRSSVQVLLVAESHGRVHGLIQAQIFDTPDAPMLVPRRRLHVEELVVAPGARRRGIGRQLVREAIRWGSDRRANQVVLVVWGGNARAERFYSALGFRTAHRVLSLEIDPPSRLAGPRSARPPASAVKS